MTSDTPRIPPDEQPLSLTEAAQLFRAKRPPCIRTMRRWITRGVISRGRRVYLEALRINGHLVTCAAWCREFDELRIEPIERPEPLIRSRRAESRAVAEARRRIAELKP